MNMFFWGLDMLYSGTFNIRAIQGVPGFPFQWRCAFFFAPYSGGLRASGQQVANT